MLLFQTSDIVENYGLRGGMKLDEHAAKIGTAMQYLLAEEWAGPLAASAVLKQIGTAMAVGQLELWHNRLGQCLGYVAWAGISEDVLDEICAGGNPLADPANWISGDTLWIAYARLPQGSLRSVMRQSVGILERYRAIAYPRLRGGGLVCRITPIIPWISAIRRHRCGDRDGADVRPYVYFSSWHYLLKAIDCAFLLERLTADGAPYADQTMGAVASALGPAIELRQFSWSGSLRQDARIVAWAWCDKRKLADRLETPLRQLSVQHWNDGAVPVLMIVDPQPSRSDVAELADLISRVASRPIPPDAIAMHSSVSRTRSAPTWLSDFAVDG